MSNPSKAPSSTFIFQFVLWYNDDHNKPLLSGLRNQQILQNLESSISCLAFISFPGQYSATLTPSPNPWPPPPLLNIPLKFYSYTYTLRTKHADHRCHSRNPHGRRIAAIPSPNLRGVHLLDPWLECEFPGSKSKQHHVFCSPFPFHSFIFSLFTEKYIQR